MHRAPAPPLRAKGLTAALTHVFAWDGLGRSPRHPPLGQPSFLAGFAMAWQILVLCEICPCAPLPSQVRRRHPTPAAQQAFFRDVRWTLLDTFS